MSKSTGLLLITDGDTIIDLHKGGFRLVNWTPATAQPKGGGVWNDSMLDDNRRPVMFKRANVSETFNLRVATNSQDDTIRETQELRRLLEKAKDYWTTDWQNEPVWLVARGACEANTRYAYIVNYTAERDDDPYQSPFWGSTMATMDQFDLIIERMDWMDNPPGEGDCVELSSTQYYTSGADGDFVPTQSEDDVEIVTTSSTASLAGTAIHIGAIPNVATYASGIRFRNVSVPVGATITLARIEIYASHSDSTGTIRIRTYGDSDTTPAVFSTYANFIGRTKTSSSQSYSFSTAWVAGTAYDLMPDNANSRAIVQEIIDSPGWVANNDMAFLIYDNGSNDYRRYASWDNVTYTEPTLYLEWTTGATEAGRSATCLNEVYVANKHNEAQITHVYAYDAAPAGWTDVMAGPLPIGLFPAIPAAGDILYIGITDAAPDTGPFSSVVFDIGTAANDITNVLWKYWDSAAWSVLTVNSTIDTTPEYFNNTGVGSISFEQPDDWATTAVNGVTGYWIQAEIQAGGVGAAPTAPTQQNRDIYTIIRPSVDIDELQVMGDITALARALVYSWSIDEQHSVILATRSTERGSNFRMYINAADEQNIPEITVSLTGAGTSFADYVESPTGRAVLYNPGAGGSGSVEFYIDSSVAPDYVGQYRIYARVTREGAVNDCTMRLQVGVRDYGGITETYYYTSDTITVSTTDEALLIDFGVVDVPGLGVTRASEDYNDIVLKLSLANTTATPQLYIYDLILIPVDEWSGEFVSTFPNSTYYETIGTIDYASYKYLDVDSLDQKTKLNSHIRSHPGDLIQYVWKYISSEPMQLQANKDQQLFVLFRRFEYLDGVWLADISGLGTITVDATARYISMRGNR